MVSVLLGSQINRTVGTCYVYLKQTWSDDWTLYPRLHCHEAVWSLSPSMPVATIESLYGFLKQEGETEYRLVDKLDVIGWYVKVVFEYDTTQLMEAEWHGVVVQVEDMHEGLVTVGTVTRATGIQTLHCCGLEKLLDTEYIHESAVDDGNTAVFWTALPIEFNRGAFPNRAELPRAPANTQVFDGTTHILSGTTRFWWSTDTIVKYLLGWAIPKANFGNHSAKIAYELYDPKKLLPETDHPVVPQEGHTVLSVLHRLIDRRRMRSFYLTVNDDVTPNTIRLMPVCWNATSIWTADIDDFEYVQPSDNLVELIFDASQSTTAIIRASRAAKYDRVLVRGARRTSTCTLPVDATNGLEIAWSAALESEYEDGASNEVDYATYDQLTQMQHNAEVRSGSELSGVYSWFYIPDGWSRVAIDPVTSSPSFVFVGANSGISYIQDIHEIACEPWLPLWEHVDYATVSAVTDPPARAWRRPFAVFQCPESERWVHGDAVSTLAESSADATDDGENYRWNAHVRTQPDTKTIEIHVSGEPQHVIAYTDFSPLAEDRNLGKFDYRASKMLVTLCLRDNRSAEGAWPANPHENSGTLVDQVYGLVIYAGDDYRQDYLVAGTVIDVDDAGALVQSTGGYVRDDTLALTAMAYLTYQWWHEERISITLSTLDLSTYLHPGWIITTIGDPTVAGNQHYVTTNSLITQARLSWPRLSPGQRDAPSLTIHTETAELDLMSLLPPAAADKLKTSGAPMTLTATRGPRTTSRRRR